MYDTVSCQLHKAGSAASPVRVLLKCDGTLTETRLSFGETDESI